MMKKLLSVLLAYAIVLTLLPATFSVSAAETATVSQRAATASNSVLDEVPSALKGTSVNMLIWWNKGEDDQKKADEFSKTTGIDVTYTTVSYNSYLNELSSMIMAGNSPSLAAMTNEWYPAPITRGLFQPIYAADGWDWSDESIYATDLMEQFSHKGVQYGIQLKTYPLNFCVVFYNKEILKTYGVVQDPYQLWKAGKWNWDTCLEIAQKCTDPEKGIYGITDTLPYAWMLSAGEDFVKMTDTGLVNNASSSGLLNAWNWMWDLKNTYKVIDTSHIGLYSFYNGKVAMLDVGSYYMQAAGSNYVPQNMSYEWGVVPFPSPAGQTFTSACYGTVWGFPKKITGDDLQAAAWYLRYYLDDFNIDFVRDDFYDPDHPECYEIIEWMWNQEIQSYNAFGVLKYGGWDDISLTSYMVEMIWHTSKKWLEDDVKGLGYEFTSILESIKNSATESGCTSHTYTNSCDTMCNVCGAKRTGHTYKSATCTKPKTCKVCGATSGKKLGHTYDNACDKSCNRCKAPRTIKHSYKAATCTKAKTCKICGATSGSKLGHKYTNACDTTCNTCKATRKITHSYKTVTKKATTSANGYTVKRCSVCKKETGKTTIYKASTIKLSKTAYVYNGKVQKPSVVIKDSKGKTIAAKNYTVTYASGRKNVGTYKVTIKFKGNYSGTKTLTFKINPAGTTVSKLTAAKKGFKVAITKKTAQVTGYEVQYATNKNFKSAKTKTLTSYKKNTLTLSSLKAKTTYYVRVRTYKVVNGKKVYSAWSAVKSVKTK